MTGWQDDWAQFVNHVADLHEAGENDVAISAALGGKTIQWQGVIDNLGLDSEYVRGPQLNMPEVRRPLRNGKVLVGNFAAVITKPEDEDAWRRFAPGDSVTVVAKLTAMTNPIGPDINIAYDEGHDDVLLMVLLWEGRPGSFP